MLHDVDVIILGLGAMGSAAAYELSSRGKKVLAFERHHPAHAFGSSHGGSRIIRKTYSEHPNYVPLLSRAYELWRRLEQDDGSSLLQITGGVYIGARDGTLLKGAIRSANVHHLPHEILNAAELGCRFPALRPSSDEIGLYETEAGVLRPELAVAAFLRQAAIHGADLHFIEPISKWEVIPTGGVRVTTVNGVYEAAKLVIAPGAWGPEIFSTLRVPLVVRRHVMAWFDPIGGIEAFLPDRFPVYLWQSDPDHLFYGFPAIDGPGGGVKVAMHTGGDLCTPNSIDRNITSADEQELREQIASRLPSLNGPLLRAASCMYTLTPDEHFVVGLHPDHPDIAIACGFSGHGFKFASVIGEVLADLIVDGRTTDAIDFLSPKRFGEPTL